MSQNYGFDFCTELFHQLPLEIKIKLHHASKAYLGLLSTRVIVQNQENKDSKGNTKQNLL